MKVLLSFRSKGEIVLSHCYTLLVTCGSLRGPLDQTMIYRFFCSLDMESRAAAHSPMLLVLRRASRSRLNKLAKRLSCLDGQIVVWTFLSGFLPFSGTRPRRILRSSWISRLVHFGRRRHLRSRLNHCRFLLQRDTWTENKVSISEYKELAESRQETAYKLIFWNFVYSRLWTTCPSALG